VIVVRGAREHNLRIDELVVPKRKLVVFTGVSGSGKSSLAFDTLYAEGQRRYVESLSSYARQFLGQMEKPAYDHIRGLSPTIAIEQKASSSNPRSTVGTITEILDYLRVLYARIGQQHCPACGDAVETLSPGQIVERVAKLSGPRLLLAPLVENRKGAFEDLFEGLRQRGFLRLRIDGVVERVESLTGLDKKRRHSIELVIDRLDPGDTSRARLTEAVESALAEGNGTLLVAPADGGAEVRFSRVRACQRCGVGLPELSPQSFSFNSPLGMCPACNGLGRRVEMDGNLLVPDAAKSLHEGAIVPFASVLTRRSGITYGIFAAVSRELGVSLDKPWKTLPKKQRDLILFGTGDRRVKVSWVGTHGEASWPMQFEGVVPLLMRRFHETKSEGMRRQYAQYLMEADCPECEGARLRPESRAVRVAGSSLVEVVRMSVAQAYEHFEHLPLEGSAKTVAGEVLKEVQARLGFMRSVGLGYLTLDRAGGSLSGGEAQRIRLASQLGSELSGVTYVLDEPSIGLHQRDNDRLIETLRRLRDLDNTVIVVEHDADTILSADHVVDFGPGAGVTGGRVVFSGTAAALLEADTLTGRYLSGRLAIDTPRERRAARGALRVLGASEHNLKDLSVEFPLGTLTAVTGVSGAGKSSLVTSILYPALAKALHGAKQAAGAHAGIEGLEQIDKIIHIDQDPIGRTPRSNPVTYTKAFDLIRDVFVQLPDARARGYAAGRFSFNVAGGRCEACEGDGVRRVEMHFLPDVFVTCEVCRGRRYEASTLEVKYRGLSIADVLELSVGEAIEVFSAHPKLKRILETLVDVGLEYVKLGQPAPTLSGGEAQRVKLSRELARSDTGRTLYVLDEPTTGLHFEDIRKLLGVLHRLVDAGNTVIVIEHNLDVIKCADHVIDLGPEGGAAGGHIVAEGTPEAIARVPGSYTGRYLAELLVRQSKTLRAARAAVARP
jgi:excinuclease ABC subunit A